MDAGGPKFDKRTARSRGAGARTTPDSGRIAAIYAALLLMPGFLDEWLTLGGDS
jgi:hypothetical protein